MTFSARQLYLRALERMAQEFAVLHKMDLDAASEKIEDILGIPKEIDLNAVEVDEDEIEEESEQKPAEWRDFLSKCKVQIANNKSMNIIFLCR